MATPTAVIIGVGPENGLGATLCRRFANQGLHTLVVGRTLAKVAEVAESIRASGDAATPFEVDATDEVAIQTLIEEAEAIGPIALAIYNAGNNMPGDFLTMESAYFERCWRIACFGGFVFARETLGRMAPRGAGTLLFTGASASIRGKPNFAALTAAKAGLRALSQSLAREFGPLGIHVGHVVIDGGINGDRLVKGRPDFAAKAGSDGLIGLQGIADLYQLLHNQPRDAWSHEIDVRTHKEAF
jgi:NAD(P)-dependent dehydrogenase (short-subunit alcohol dehydrogenase family)